MSSNLDKVLSDFVIVYEYHVIDKFGRIYIFSKLSMRLAQKG
jgi:hypothetical protein